MAKGIIKIIFIILIIGFPLITNSDNKVPFQPMSEKEVMRLAMELDEALINRMTVEASGYNAWDPKQTDDSPGITATGYRWKKGDKLIALSRDLLKIIPYKTEVKIQGLGVYQVEDTMNRRYFKTVDIAFDTKHEARKWGRKLINIEWQG